MRKIALLPPFGQVPQANSTISLSLPLGIRYHQLLLNFLGPFTTGGSTTPETYETMFQRINIKINGIIQRTYTPFTLRTLSNLRQRGAVPALHGQSWDAFPTWPYPAWPLSNETNASTQHSVAAAIAGDDEELLKNLFQTGYNGSGIMLPIFFSEPFRATIGDEDALAWPTAGLSSVEVEIQFGTNIPAKVEAAAIYDNVVAPIGGIVKVREYNFPGQQGLYYINNLPKNDAYMMFLLDNGYQIAEAPNFTLPITTAQVLVNRGIVHDSRTRAERLMWLQINQMNPQALIKHNDWVGEDQPVQDAYRSCFDAIVFDMNDRIGDSLPTVVGNNPPVRIADLEIQLGLPNNNPLTLTAVSFGIPDGM